MLASVLTRGIEMDICENELLAHYFGKVGADPIAITKHLGGQNCSTLREVLAILLFEEAQSPSSPYLAFDAEQLADTTSYKSILYKGGGYSGERWILSFTFKDALNETALPLLGILIAIFGGPLTLATVPAALGVAKLLWGKLAVLREPEDAHAIRLLEALSEVRVRNLLDGLVPEPAWHEILEQTDLTGEQALAALKQLRVRKIVDVAQWGDQSENLEHLQNRWKVTL